MNKTVSIIVPTHNRCLSLKRLLDILSLQTYPLLLLEAIIVADGCIDDTIKVLEQYKCSYNLRWIELSGMGASTARNAGAAVATGEILLFLDDDIEPSLGLVEAHMLEHKNDNSVVVGYLPMALPVKASFHQINLTSWWEQKYFQMKNQHYRYSYEDLLSGNFSINAKLFNGIHKFDIAFKCREDYELGARLIKAGAEFTFSTKAWGYHRDESTNFNKLLERRRAEGRADVHFAAKHPDLLKILRVNQYSVHISRTRKIFLYFAFNFPAISDHFCSYLLSVMNFYERVKKRFSWHKINSRLNDYWYIRGITDEFKTKKEFLSFIAKLRSETPKEDQVSLQIDLRAGVLEAERQIDRLRPAGMQIFFGDHFIGKVKPVPGAEKLKGIHLKSILATQFPDTLTYAIMIEDVIKTSEAPSNLKN